MESEIISDVAYVFGEDQDGIIRVIAYERKGYQFTVARISPADHFVVAESLLDPFSTEAIAGLGVFQCLRVVL